MRGEGRLMAPLANPSSLGVSFLWFFRSFSERKERTEKKKKKEKRTVRREERERNMLGTIVNAGAVVLGGGLGLLLKKGPAGAHIGSDHGRGSGSWCCTSA